MTKIVTKDDATLVGVVTHYFNRIGVAAVKLLGTLRVGDSIRIIGATTDFEDVVRSIEVEHETVEEAKAGEEIGIRLKEKVREGDRVYLLG